MESSHPQTGLPVQAPFHTPYPEASTNLLYNLLFCDSSDLYRKNMQAPHAYPFTILLADQPEVSDLKQILDDSEVEPRAKVLACRALQSAGEPTGDLVLYGILVELGLDDGLDVLATFANGTACYINQTGRVVIWETTTDATMNALTRDLFEKGMQIVQRIGPWDQPRRRHPARGVTRLTFLVSDGLYFGEGATASFFGDPLASPALTAATQILQYITSAAQE